MLFVCVGFSFFGLVCVSGCGLRFCGCLRFVGFYVKVLGLGFWLEVCCVLVFCGVCFLVLCCCVILVVLGFSLVVVLFWFWFVVVGVVWGGCFVVVFLWCFGPLRGGGV